MTIQPIFASYRWPDERGHFGPYGGKFVPETLMPALDELESVYLKAPSDADFQAELDSPAAHLRGPAHAASPMRDG
jgi:tryptophan synthase beta chain